MDTAAEIIAQAQKEYAEELFREAVEKHKTKLRDRRTIWDRLFPWRIIIIRKGKP
jgi:hypothetical protein